MFVTALLAMLSPAIQQAADAPFGSVEELGAAGGTALFLGFGRSVHLLGDLDGGGEADLLVGLDREGVAVVRGETGGLLRIHGSLALAPGLAADALGDLDGDGVCDYGFATQAPDRCLTVHVHSGASGALLFERHTGIWTQSAWHVRVSGGADVDGDGVADVAVASSYASAGPSAPSGTGAAEVVSGRDGALLHAWQGRLAGESLGRLATLVQDTDGDGHGEVFYMTWDSASGQQRSCLRSGADGSVLWTRHYSLDQILEVCVPGDLDADGVPDLAVVSDDVVACLSGADGGVLRERAVDYYTYYSNAVDVAVAGDQDGDGVADLVLPFDRGIRVVCGRTLRDLAVHVPDEPLSYTVDIDACEDPAVPGSLLVAFGRPSHSPGGLWNAGRVDVARFRPGLRIDRPVIHFFQPQPVDWQADMGPAYAGRPYFLTVSALGLGDSLFLGTRVPLDMGGTVSEIPFTLPSGVAARPGRLDAAGRATGSVPLVPGQLLPFIGMHLWFSAVVPSLVQEGRSSLAVPVLVMP